MLELTTVATPAGALTFAADTDGVLTAAGFTTAEPLLERLGRPQFRLRPELGAISRAARRYLDGELDAFDELPAAQPGGPFLQRAWSRLREVPAGTTISYARLAELAGSAAAVRAAGQACARNLIAPVIPCHRVLRSDGTLGGYAYGLAVKRWLLEHERRAPDPGQRR